MILPWATVCTVGSAEGFGGTLVLDVTVEGGKITAIEIVETSETPFIADTAFKELIRDC